jgi:redox-sensitive bicupin YhaK (pirin superfamily)
LPAGAVFEHAIPAEKNAFAYVVDGEASFGEDGKMITAEHVAHFGAGDGVRVVAGGAGAQLLLVSGRPLGEPVAWYGPIVMNTEAELRLAFEEYQNGTFVKKGVGK